MFGNHNMKNFKEDRYNKAMDNELEKHILNCEMQALDMEIDFDDEGMFNQVKEEVKV